MHGSLRSNVSSRFLELIYLVSPLVVILILYEYSRSLAFRLGPAIDYNLPLSVENAIFGAPLAVYFQSASFWLFNLVFSIVYSLHPTYFILLLLYLLIYKKDLYKHALVAVTIASGIAIALYIFWPVAPPWIAVPGITRIPNYVFRILGIEKSIDPNAYAAMPSMHVAYAYFFAYYSLILGSRSKRLLVLAGRLILLFMPITVIYTGNHYLLDVLAGIGVAVLSIEAANIAYRKIQPSWIVFMRQS